jgi:hypothetical protein
MHSDKPDPMTSPDKDKPGNHPASRPEQEPDPQAQKSTERPGDPGLLGGPSGAGFMTGTGGSRG